MQLYLAGRPIRNLGHLVRLGTVVVREELALQRGARRMPRPAAWDWARPRLLPLLAGPCIDVDSDGPIRATVPLGCTVVFAVDLGRAFAIVDGPVANRWECTVDQISDVAFDNLRRRASRLDAGLVRGGSLSGYPIRILRYRPLWATSLVLVADELRRLFGGSDQLLLAPERSTLIGLPLSVPGRIAADILVDFEEGAAWPLMLDPFTLVDGTIEWSGALENEADTDAP